jgi:hypothetical protein
MVIFNLLGFAIGVIIAPLFAIGLDIHVARGARSTSMTFLDRLE